MSNNLPIRIKNIQEFHKFRQLPPPEHPLISVVDYSLIKGRNDEVSESFMLDFYSISLKHTTNAKMKYGQQDYDFDSGVLFFLAPHQVFSVQQSDNGETQHTGWLLLIHPDFLWNTVLAKKIRKFEFFDYAVNEALFLSDKEEIILLNLIQNIRQEYQTNLDRYSQDIIVSQIETLLNYSERFYQRQFMTRQISSHQILERLENFLNDYFNGNAILSQGLPKVQFIADSLHISPSYLGSLLKSLTGMNTQQHIHHKLIDKAKEKLSTTDLSVNEIAYELGFEYPQSFSKLFKAKTNVSPIEFRQSFN